MAAKKCADMAGTALTQDAPSLPATDDSEAELPPQHEHIDITEAINDATVGDGTTSSSSCTYGTLDI